MLNLLATKLRLNINFISYLYIRGDSLSHPYIYYAIEIFDLRNLPKSGDKTTKRKAETQAIAYRKVSPAAIGLTIYRRDRFCREEIYRLFTSG
jgi:hypothetical protein